VALSVQLVTVGIEVIVGAETGDCVGAANGKPVGAGIGDDVGAGFGDALGNAVGAGIGAEVGAGIGAGVVGGGIGVGTGVGIDVGVGIGNPVISQVAHETGQLSVAVVPSSPRYSHRTSVLAATQVQSFQVLALYHVVLSSQSSDVTDVNIVAARMNMGIRMPLEFFMIGVENEGADS